MLLIKKNRLETALQIVILSFSLLMYSLYSLHSQEIPITADSRIKTLVYNPNEVYQLKFHYGYQSFIELSKDESIEMISMGESFAWRLTPVDRRLFIRPLEIAAHTNMTIITNKRTYQFDIRSGEYDGKADEELIYSVRFFYPNPKLRKNIPPNLSKRNPEVISRKRQKAKIIRSRVPLQKINSPLKGMLKLNSTSNIINFDYEFTGTSKEIRPIQIYDNGQETSFQFKNNNLAIPTISSVDIFGVETPTSYVIKDNYIVVPSVERQYTLRLADSLLCVFNNNYSKRDLK